jgi:hypothetical protein
VYDSKRGVLLLPCCRNNTNVLLLNSTDSGLTWSLPRDLTSQVSQPSWSWYATGPPGGVQLASGRLLVPSNHVVRDGNAAFSHVMFRCFFDCEKGKKEKRKKKEGTGFSPPFHHQK